MRNIRLSRLISLILTVATLIFFISCGIPFFINFDNDIALKKGNSTDKEIEFTVTISARGLNKIQADPDYNFSSTPSLKFFYVLSNESGRTSYLPPNEIYRIDNIEGIFRSNYKGSTGNGYPLIVPTFYIYTMRVMAHNFARSRQLFKIGMTQRGGHHSWYFHNETEGQFNGAPKMDYLLEIIGSQDLY